MPPQAQRKTISPSEKMDAVQDIVEEITRMEGMPYLYTLVSDLASIMKAEIIRLEHELEVIQEQVYLFVRDETHPSDIIKQLQTQMEDMKQDLSSVTSSSLMVTEVSRKGIQEANVRLQDAQDDIIALAEAFEQGYEKSEEQAGAEESQNAEIIERMTNLAKQNEELEDRMRKLESQGMMEQVVKYVRPKRSASPPPPMKDGKKKRSLEERIKLLSKLKSRTKVVPKKPERMDTVLYGLENDEATESAKKLLYFYGIDFEFVRGKKGEGLYPKLHHEGKIRFGVKDIAILFRKPKSIPVSEPPKPLFLKDADMVKCQRCGTLNKKGNVICCKCSADMPDTVPPIPHPAVTVEESEEEDPPFRKVNTLKEGENK